MVGKGEDERSQCETSGCWSAPAKRFPHHGDDPCRPDAEVTSLAHEKPYEPDDSPLQAGSGLQPVGLTTLV